MHVNRGAPRRGREAGNARPYRWRTATVPARAELIPGLFLGDLDDDLDGAPFAQCLEDLFEVLQTLDAMGDEPGEPPGPSRVRQGHVADALFEVIAVGIDRPHHDLVAEHH